MKDLRLQTLREKDEKNMEVVTIQRRIAELMQMLALKTAEVERLSGELRACHGELSAMQAALTKRNVDMQGATVEIARLSARLTEALSTAEAKTSDLSTARKVV
jgi:hypothetical protein